MNRKGVLLLGGAGFIGSALARRLEKDKRSVHILGRDDAKQLGKALPQCGKVIHLASATTSDLGMVAENIMKKTPPSEEHVTLESERLTSIPPAPSTKSICAVVIAYFPDEGFEARLQTILPQVGRLVIVDNTPDADSLSPEMIAAWGERLHCIANHANRGVAAALNQGLEHALQIGCKWLLTLDQDTQCYSDMVATLLQMHEACELKAAVIGGNYFDAQNHQLKVPAGGETECLEQKTVITSGSLVDADVAREVGGFREDYFIDQVDHEFCLRVRTHGYRVVISRKPVMAHSVGGPGGARLPLLGILPNHPPLRKYYIARNTVVTVADYWRREPVWCLRRSVRLLLGLLLMSTLENQRLVKVRAFVAGFMDGVRGRMGPCSRKWLYHP